MDTGFFVGLLAAASSRFRELAGILVVGLVVAGKVAKHKDWLSPVHEKKPAKVSKEKA